MHIAFIPLAGAALRGLPRHAKTSLSHARRVVHPAPARMAAECGKQEPYSNRSFATAEEDNVMRAVEQKISEALSPTKLNVVPTYGDPKGSHVTISVVSPQFEGWSLVKRHQAVYKAIWEELQGPIHAVDNLTTKTPSEDSS